MKSVHRRGPFSAAFTLCLVTVTLTVTLALGQKDSGKGTPPAKSDAVQLVGEPWKDTS